MSRFFAPHRAVLSLAAGTLLGLGLASVAQASVYTLDDFLFAQELKNSGDATEKGALETFLGGGTTLIQDYKGNLPGLQKDDAGHWYIDVAPNEPGYFVLKFGAGSSGLADHYYFENVGELGKLVFTDAQVDGLIGSGDTPKAFSHYVTYDGDGGGGGGGGGFVPEPGSLALAGLGLIAACLTRRRQPR